MVKYLWFQLFFPCVLIFFTSCSSKESNPNDLKGDDPSSLIVVQHFMKELKNSMCSGIVSSSTVDSIFSEMVDGVNSEEVRQLILILHNKTNVETWYLRPELRHLDSYMPVRVRSLLNGGDDCVIIRNYSFFVERVNYREGNQNHLVRYINLISDDQIIRIEFIASNN